MRVLVYADTDINLIDGSSVWTASVTELLASLPDAQVTLLLKRPLERGLVLERVLAGPNVQVLDPWNPSFPQLEGPAPAWKKRGRLTPEEAAGLVAALTERDPYEMILLRGFQLCQEALRRDHVASRAWAYVTGFTEDDRAAVEFIHARAARVLCQTPQLQAAIKGLLKTPQDKFVLLPPMIPDLPEAPPSFSRRGRRLVYVGKMAPLWRTDEMVTLFPRIRNLFPDAEFHIAGDKFHNAGDFPARMRALLEGTPGVVWRQAISREQTQQLIAECDLGCSWRHGAIDESLELSTKLLEYASQGRPAVLNRTPMHEQLLGQDFPFFCNDEEEFLEAVTRAFRDDAAYARAAQTAWEVARGFTFSAARERLLPHLPAPTAAPAPAPAPHKVSSKGKLRVGFAGHDLKFAASLIAELSKSRDFEVRVDEWAHHQDHDEKQSRDLAQWADVVVAEWCLGNAVWYSRHLPEKTGLIVRLHRVELTSKYPDEMDAARVNRLIAIAPAYAKKIAERLPGLAARIVHIPQPINCHALQRRKLVGSEYRIGMLGWCPRLKRPDLAVDIFERLRLRDPRYQLFFKGKFPTDLAWLWRREEEQRYYEDLLARINAGPWRDSVIFEDFGADVPVWFQKIGFLLSTSDVEGCHVSVSEAMASGAAPIIRDWEGAGQVYPEEYVFHRPREAVELIERLRLADGGLPASAARLQTYARTHFDLPTVKAQWEAVIRSVAEEARGRD